MTKKLREGFTTGTASSAAAKAGVIYLLTGRKTVSIKVPLPREGRYTVPVAGYEPEQDGVRVTVIKDGGDDPDATHRARIQAVVRLDAGAETGSVALDGGKGVGRVTLPGLPVPVGEAAINPDPRRQIRAAVREAMNECGFAGGAEVLIEVPDGEEIATRTMNARLGILGGISILGTHGTVKPFSHESYKATIAQGLSVARTAGHEEIGFSTGGRSERLLMEILDSLPPLAFIQVADFFAFSMREAADRGVGKVRWGVFFGKLVKHAQGFEYTHAKDTSIDFRKLAGWCLNAGIPQDVAREAEGANTARQVLEMVRGLPGFPSLMEALCAKAMEHALRYAGKRMSISYYVFDFEGGLVHSRHTEA